MKDLFCVAIGGAIGATARYLLASGIQQAIKHDFPYGILAVNVIGSFILGVIADIPEHLIPASLRIAVVVGFLGSLTTFSSLSRDTVVQAENHWSLGTANLLLNVVLGIIAVLMGRYLAQRFI